MHAITAFLLSEHDGDFYCASSATRCLALGRAGTHMHATSNRSATSPMTPRAVVPIVSVLMCAVHIHWGTASWRLSLRAVAAMMMLHEILSYRVSSHPFSNGCVALTSYENSRSNTSQQLDPQSTGPILVPPTHSAIGRRPIEIRLLEVECFGILIVLIARRSQRLDDSVSSRDGVLARRDLPLAYIFA